MCNRGTTCIHQPWEAWEPPPKLGFMELINQYEIMQHLWHVVKLYVFFHVFYILSTVTKQVDADVTGLKRQNVICHDATTLGSLSHVPEATSRQQQKQLQQQRHEQQMLRQQRLFEGAFGAASDRHGGHVNLQ